MSILGDIYDGGGAKPARFERIGDTVKGEVEQVRTKQLAQFGSERLETWPNGDPKMTPIVTVATSQCEDNDDDGRRDLYMRGGLFTAFSQALREAFPQRPDDRQLIGAIIEVRFDSTVPTNKGNPRKVYRARITLPSSTGDAWDDVPPAPPADAYDDGLF